MSNSKDLDDVVPADEAIALAREFLPDLMAADPEDRVMAVARILTVARECTYRGYADGVRDARAELLAPFEDALESIGQLMRNERDDKRWNGLNEAADVLRDAIRRAKGGPDV